jgi:hypothetical protein
MSILTHQMVTAYYNHIKFFFLTLNFIDIYERVEITTRYLYL